MRSVAWHGHDRDIADGDGGDGARTVVDRCADRLRYGGDLAAGDVCAVSLHDALPIYRDGDRLRGGGGGLAVGVARGGGDREAEIGGAVGGRRDGQAGQSQIGRAHV